MTERLGNRASALRDSLAYGGDGFLDDEVGAGLAELRTRAARVAVDARRASAAGRRGQFLGANAVRVDRQRQRRVGKARMRADLVGAACERTVTSVFEATPSCVKGGVWIGAK